MSTDAEHTQTPLDRVALALSDPTRLRILDLLTAGREEACCSPENPEAPGTICACDLLLHLDMAPSKLSYHMRELREAGLTREQKRGRWVYYSLDHAALAAYLTALTARYLTRSQTDCDCTVADSQERQSS